ncbi:transposase domain-containing protein [Streptomyces sp. RKAG290]|uniref:transposase domain-containing protein n=1 Tax=Streptomyces sp. RKAG290 TaxID=2888348 RepID=UPI0027E270CC|nr:transposase domain-containing protein [Streptomyces sp. RKAG290]
MPGNGDMTCRKRCGRVRGSAWPMQLLLSCGDRCPTCDGWGAGQRVRIGILTKVFTAELVDEAIAKHDRAERRRRLLPARLVVYFVLALCLFARESYEEVLRVLTSGIPGSRTLASVNRFLVVPREIPAC